MKIWIYSFLCAAAKWESEDEFESVSQVTGPVSLFEFVKHYFICVLWLMISYVYYGPNYIQSNIMVDDFICVLWTQLYTKQPLFNNQEN